MKYLLTLTLLASMAFLFGCQTGPKISSEFNPEADFSNLSKYVLLPLPTDIPGGDPGMILRTGKMVEKATADALSAKGFERVDFENADQADFTVKLTGKVVPKLDVADMGYQPRPVLGWYGFYQPFYYEREVYLDQYEEGTLIIEIYDTATKELNWVGWGVARKRSEAPEESEIRAAVTSILADFPPN